MLNAEKAFDILPYFIEIYEKLNLKKYMVENQKKVVETLKDKSEEEVALIKMDEGKNVLIYICKNNKVVKDEFFTIISIIKDISVDEAKKLKLNELLEIFNEIAKENDLMDFFYQAVQ